jgi:hypothetical protein
MKATESITITAWISLRMMNAGMGCLKTVIFEVYAMHRCAAHRLKLMLAESVPVPPQALNLSIIQSRRGTRWYRHGLTVNLQNQLCAPKKQNPRQLALPGILKNTSLTMSYFHTGIRTIIGAASFHGPVRDGKGWFQRAMVIRLNWSACMSRSLFAGVLKQAQSGKRVLWIAAVNFTAEC